MLHLKSFGQTGGPNGAIDWLEFTSLLEHHSKWSTLSHESFSSYIFFLLCLLQVFHERKEFHPVPTKWWDELATTALQKMWLGYPSDPHPNSFCSGLPICRFFRSWNTRSDESGSEPRQRWSSNPLKSVRHPVGLHPSLQRRRLCRSALNKKPLGRIVESRWTGADVNGVGRQTELYVERASACLGSDPNRRAGRTTVWQAGWAGEGLDRQDWSCVM